MKLVELVKAYKGNAKFDVNHIVEDEKKDLITFNSAEYAAVKDEILNGEVSKYNVTGFTAGVPTIEVIIKEAEPEPEPEQGQEQGQEEQNQPQTSDPGTE